MTNKPMLSVELCALLERAVLELPFCDARHELRALLDKPEDKICSVCNGFGRYQDGDSGTDEDGRCPNIVDCDCGDSERIPEYRAKPAAKNQGEPVAWGNMLPGWRDDDRLLLTSKEAFEEHVKASGSCVMTPLYAEQPAPVAITKNCCGSCPGGCVIGLNGVKP